MHFLIIFAVFMAALVSAAVDTTDKANPISAPVASTIVKSGEKFNIEWLPTAGKFVTLTLRKGDDEKHLQAVEIIAEHLPNSGIFIWIPSTDLSGDSDYSIQIESDDPATSNYSAKFRIVSQGKGIIMSTVMPTTTYAATASVSGSAVPTYTGPATETSAAPDAGVSTFEGDAIKGKQLGSWFVMGAAAVGGMLVGGAQVW